MDKVKKGVNAREQRTLARECKKLLKCARTVLSAQQPRRRKGEDARADHAVLLRQAWREHDAIMRAVTTARDIRQKLPNLRLASFQRLDRQGLPSNLKRVLPKYFGNSADRVTQLLVSMGGHGMMATFGGHTFEAVADHLAHEARMTLQRIGKLQAFPHPESGYQTMAAEGEIVCLATAANGATTPVSPWICVAIGIGLLIWWLAEGVEDPFNETDDDKAREEINGSECDAIKAQNNSHWISRFSVMIDGPTGDDDERAMLKVLNCLSAERVRDIVNQFGLSTLMDEFQGDEWDELVVRLQECGLLTFKDWDDDATRLFINESSQATLGSLSVDDIVQLCKNCFSGSCGDEDENAIIRLISSQDKCKIQEILGRISMEEFDDNVDGDEWDELSGILFLAQFPPC